MSLCGNNSAPALRERQKIHPPLKVKGLYYNRSNKIFVEKNVDAKSYLMSKRGSREFRPTWQSRGSAHTNKVAFQRIATLRHGQSRLAMIKYAKPFIFKIVKCSTDITVISVVQLVAYPVYFVVLQVFRRKELHFFLR